MSEASRMPLTRRVEGLAGTLVLMYGLIIIGILTFAPLQTIHNISVTGVTSIVHSSLWDLFGPFILWPLGLAALVVCLLCLLCLFAIAVGAYAQAVRHAEHGRLWLWLGTAVLALELASTMIIASTLRFEPLFPMTRFAPYLLPALVLAALASGAATIGSSAIHGA